MKHLFAYLQWIFVTIPAVNKCLLYFIHIEWIFGWHTGTLEAQAKRFNVDTHKYTENHFVLNGATISINATNEMENCGWATVCVMHTYNAMKMSD